MECNLVCSITGEQVPPTDKIPLYGDLLERFARQCGIVSQGAIHIEADA